MARSLIRKPPANAVERPEPRVQSHPATPLELAAVEALRNRDGVTRASALERVRGQPPELLEALLQRSEEGGRPPQPRPPLAEAACHEPGDDEPPAAWHERFPLAPDS